MKFSELEKPWQEVFELGWQSFCEGNLPIGAVIVDDSGKTLSFGRNQYVTSKRFPNCKVDHAETECIQLLDIEKYPDLKNYTLYTSMEPCPMCIGTIIMSNLKQVRAAARDPWAGGSDICIKNAYARKKSVEVIFADDFLANMQIALQGCAELRVNGTESVVYKSFCNIYPMGASVAFRLRNEGIAERYISERTPFPEVFDNIAEML